MSVAIFGTILNLYIGFREVDPEKIKLIQTLGGSKNHALLKVILPANLVNIIGLMKSNIGLCLVGVIIGEFIASKCGLGYLIIYGSQIFKFRLGDPFHSDLMYHCHGTLRCDPYIRKMVSETYVK